MSAEPFVLFVVDLGLLLRGSTRREPLVGIDAKRALLFSDEQNALDWCGTIVPRSPSTPLRHAEYRAMRFTDGQEAVARLLVQRAFQERPVAAGVSSDDVLRLSGPNATIAFEE